MDRNIPGYAFLVSKVSVALLAEGVDRNIIVPFSGYAGSVALLAEGVDRNM